MLTYTYDVAVPVNGITGLPYNGLPYGTIGLDPKWAGEPTRLLTIKITLISTLPTTYTLTNGLTLKCDFPVDTYMDDSQLVSFEGSPFTFFTTKPIYNVTQLRKLEECLPTTVGCIVLMNGLTKQACYGSLPSPVMIKNCLIASPVIIDGKLAHDMWVI